MTPAARRQAARDEANRLSHLASLKNLRWDGREEAALWREPKSIGDLSEWIFEKLQLEEPKPQMEILQAWESILGPRAARDSTPQTISPAKILIVAVRNPILANELRFKKFQLLQQFKKLPGCGSLRGVEFIAG